MVTLLCRYRCIRADTRKIFVAICGDISEIVSAYLVPRDITKNIKLR